MNRIIKLRAWDKQRNCMVSVYRFDWDMIAEHPMEHGLNGGTGSETDEYLPFGRYELMQFTGLLDKNGKEIYEGDILETVMKDFVWRDTIDHGWAINDGEVYGWHWGRGGAIRPQDRVSERMEIIGNIYENPNLLSV